MPNFVKYFTQKNDGNEICYCAKLISSTQLDEGWSDFGINVSGEDSQESTEEYFNSFKDRPHHAEAIFAVGHDTHTLLHLDMLYTYIPPLSDGLSLVYLSGVSIFYGTSHSYKCYDPAAPFELVGSNKSDLEVVSMDDGIGVSVGGSAIFHYPEGIEKDLTIKSFMEIFNVTFAEDVAHAVKTALFVVSRPE